MPILDVDKIINGTPRKRLIHAREEMVKNYSESAAKDYRNYYMSQPLSFLLENAIHVIAEPQYGLSFMEWVVDSTPVPYEGIQTIHEAVTEYLTNNRDKMNEKLILLYESFEESLKNNLGDRFEEAAIEESMDKDNMREIYDRTYAHACEKYIESDDFAKTMFEGVANPFRESVVYGGKIPYAKYIMEYTPMERIVVLTPYYREFNVDKPLYEAFIQLATVEDDFTSKDACEKMIAYEKVQALCMSERYADSVTTFSNANARMASKGILGADIGNGIIEMYREAVEDTVRPVYDTTRSAVDALMEESNSDVLYKEDREKAKADILQLKYDVYESVRERVHNVYVESDNTNHTFKETPLFTRIKEEAGITDSVSIEDAMKIMTEAVSEIEAEMENSDFFEYADTGKINKVIAKRHGIFREDDPDASTTSKKENDDDDAEIPESAKVNHSKKAASSSLPDSSNPNSKKVTKPKSGVIGAVTNTAMDIHKKAQLGGAKLKKVGTGIKNAGTAVLKIPSNMLQGIKDIGQKFSEMDDHRREKEMLKPGYRKKIFKNVRVAATYGLAGYISPLLVPVTWFSRKLSKEKNKYIRQQFARELDTEIKICDAKIEDAIAAGDQKQRYQLLRIKDKYTQERDRVAINGKYI